MTDIEASKPKVSSIRFQVVSPLMRSTIDDAPSSSEAQVLTDALHWIWSWYVQIGRLIDSFHNEWSGKSGIEQRQASSRFSFDEHIIAVTGWNLVRALKAVEHFMPTVKLEKHHSEPLGLLRNLYEHWDEQRSSFQSTDVPKTRSGAKFAEQFPNGKPWTIVFEKDDWVLGGVVRLNDLSQALQELEEIIISRERDIQQ